MSVSPRRRLQIIGLLAISAIAATVAIPSACTGPTPYALAALVTNRDQLIGGPDALGDVGDYKISNGKVRFVIQGMNGGTGFSRGWGIYGGSLLDADLQRPTVVTNGIPNGNDRFGELFPALFLEALEPKSVSVLNSGANGEPASVVVKGSGAPFIALAQTLLNAVGLDYSAVPGAEGLELTNVYSLGPSDQYLTMTTTIAPPADSTGVSVSEVEVPLGSPPIQLAIPFGSIILFGNENNVFVPGIGFDMYYGLQNSYTTPSKLPALTGLVTDLIATQSTGVSYGIAIEPPAADALNTSYMYNNQQYFVTPPPTPVQNQMLIPFVASSFTGVFTAQAPKTIPHGSSFTYKTYFIVGQGDVGTVRDVYYGLRGTATGEISAQIMEETTHTPITTASLVVLKNGTPFAQYQVDNTGHAIGQLEPGNYQAIAVCDNRNRNPPVSFTVVAGQSTQIEGGDPTAPHALAMPRNAVLNVMVTEGSGPNVGRPLPAKVTLVATAPADATHDGLPPREFAYNLQLGDRMLASDLIPDSHVDPNTRRYVERMILSGGNGIASGQVRPNVGPDGTVVSSAVWPGTTIQNSPSYDVIVSRGPEYNTVDLGNITFAPGQVVSLGAVLTRVVDTTNYISADFHVHSNNSIDGQIDLNTRVLAYAAEGLESLTATDHNFITDYTGYILANNLQNYMRSEIGMELTTLEMGHFNAFPLNMQLASGVVDGVHYEGIDFGAFIWNNMTPNEIFQALRAPPLGMADGSTVVEVNHPRDTILGYYHQFSVSQDTGMPQGQSLLDGESGPAFQDSSGGSTISWDYDAMEVFNSKRRELLRTFRMPNAAAAYPGLLCSNENTSASCLNIPSDWPAGAIVRTPCKAGVACTDDVYKQQPIAYPGSVEDWFNLINEGGLDPSTLQSPAQPTVSSQTIHPITATGNSDSHSLYFEEAGYPRNWLLVNNDDPQAVTDQDISTAVFNHRVVLSNGPFIDLTATAPGSTTVAHVGDLLEDPATSVNLSIRVSAAPWMSVDEIDVYTNVSGNIANDMTSIGAPQVISLTNTPGVTDRCNASTSETLSDGHCVNNVTVTLPGGQDAWVVVIAQGFESMFPILTPLEQPPLQISNAISSIASAIPGFAPLALGPFQPDLTSMAVPFAMTNPIWIDGNGDGVSFGRDSTTTAISTQGQSLTSTPHIRYRATPKQPKLSAAARTPSRSSNIAKLFNAWGEVHRR